MHSVLQFLADISGKDNPFRSLQPGHLRYHATSNFQTILEDSFGSEGSGVVAITQNKVLNAGTKSLLLKIAMLTTHDQCYRILDSLYALIVAKTPGYYWDVLKAIKLINDHCNNTPNYCSLDDSWTFEDHPCQQLFFRDSAGVSVTDKVAADEFKPALQTLIKTEIEKIGGWAVDNIGRDIYKEQQIAAARNLDSVGYHCSWRLLSLSMTQLQIVTCRDPKVIAYWVAENARLNKTMTQAYIELVINLTNTNAGPDAAAAAEEAINRYIGIIKQKETEFEKREQAMLMEDFHRYQEEEALMAEIAKDATTSKNRTAPAYRS